MADRPTTLHQLADAIFRAYLGELALDERKGRNDPVKLRFGGWDDPGSEYIATLSFDVLEGDEAAPTRREQGFIGFILDPDPCIDLFLQQRAGESEDRTMTKVARFSASRIELLVPVVGMSGGGNTNQFFSHDAASGRTLMFNPQADKAWPLGGIIVYDVTGGQLTPIGKIPVSPL